MSPRALAFAFALAELASGIRGAQTRRNGRAGSERPARWRCVRDRIWELLDDVVDPGATVAVVGAGNADDLPLTRLAARARRVDLVDIDGTALAGARRRAPRGLRRRLRRIEEDVTGGAADSGPR